MGLGEMWFVIPWMLLALAPYLLALWAIALLVPLTRANRETNARLAAIETALKQRS